MKSFGDRKTRLKDLMRQRREQRGSGNTGARVARAGEAPAEGRTAEPVAARAEPVAAGAAPVVALVDYGGGSEEDDDSDEDGQGTDDDAGEGSALPEDFFDQRASAKTPQEPESKPDAVARDDVRDDVPDSAQNGDQLLEEELSRLEQEVEEEVDKVAEQEEEEEERDLELGDLHEEQEHEVMRKRLKEIRQTVQLNNSKRARTSSTDDGADSALNGRASTASAVQEPASHGSEEGPSDAESDNPSDMDWRSKRL